jgi:signal transduction histidine kinase
MTTTIEKRLPLRRFIRFSPQLVFIAAVTLALLFAMVLLGIDVLRQAEVSRAAINYNSTDVTRPFVQLQRETLRLQTLVVAGAEEFEADGFQLQYDLLLSRFDVINGSPMLQSFTPAVRELYDEILASWETTQPLVEGWQAHPTNGAAQAELVQALTDMEFLVNRTEIRYQLERGELISQLGQASQRVLFALAAASLVLALFVVIVSYSIYRFVLARRKAEDETRAAHAAEATALEANRFKDEFLATMSHELRTPLNAIIGFLGLMSMSEQLDTENSHMAERARANAERLLTLINDILDLSKIQSGRMELIETALSPRKLARRWESQMDVLAKQKGVTFTVEIDEKLPELLTIDEDAVTKVATNLLSNAFKFTDVGEVTLRLQRRDSNWIIEVQDTGIGIPAHMQQVVFESFRQVDSSYQRAHGGTGLGLAIVQQLAKAMGGTVVLVSGEGKGSTFTVTLPLHTATEQKPKVQAQGVMA